MAKNRIEIGKLYLVDIPIQFRYPADSELSEGFEFGFGYGHYYGRHAIPAGTLVVLLSVKQDPFSMEKYRRNETWIFTFLHPEFGILEKDFYTHDAFLCCLKLQQNGGTNNTNAQHN